MRFLLCKGQMKLVKYVPGQTHPARAPAPWHTCSGPGMMFPLRRLERGCFNFRARVFFLTNDGDNLSEIELVLLSGFPQPCFFFFFFGFPSVSWSLGLSGLLEQSRRDYEPVSLSSGIGCVCPAVSLCRCLWSHSDSQRLRVRQGLDSVVFGGE